jgi:hypothetical protein
MACAPFFSRAGAVLVSAHNGGIDHHIFVVMILGQQLENTFEDPALCPPAEPLVDRFPMAKPLREVAPGTSRSKSVKDSFDKQPIVLGSAAHMAFAARQKILDPIPLVVTQPVAPHRSALPSRPPRNHSSADSRIPRVTPSNSVRHLIPIRSLFDSGGAAKIDIFA